MKQKKFRNNQRKHWPRWPMDYLKIKNYYENLGGLTWKTIIYFVT